MRSYKSSLKLDVVDILFQMDCKAFLQSISGLWIDDPMSDAHDLLVGWLFWGLTSI